MYNIPETKPIMEPTIKEISKETAKPEVSPKQSIEQILENLKRLEAKDLPVADVDADKVKNLLGNLYMEMMFPHNDKETYIHMPFNENVSMFDKKA